MFRFADERQSVTALLSDAFSIYRTAFTKIWYLGLAIGVLTGLQGLVPVSGYDGGAVLNTATATKPEISWIYMLIVLVLMLPYSFFSGILLDRINRIGVASDHRIADSFKIVSQKIWTIYLASVIQILLVMAGLVFFVLPGVFLGILLIFNLPAILFEDLSAIAALKRSIQLVWGHWWRSFAVLLGGGALLAFVTMALTSVMGPDNSIGQALGDVVASTIITPFIQACVLVQFKDLRLRYKA